MREFIGRADSAANLTVSVFLNAQGCQSISINGLLTAKASAASWRTRGAGVPGM